MVTAKLLLWGTLVMYGKVLYWFKVLIFMYELLMEYTLGVARYNTLHVCWEGSLQLWTLPVSHVVNCTISTSFKLTIVLCEMTKCDTAHPPEINLCSFCSQESQLGRCFIWSPVGLYSYSCFVLIIWSCKFAVRALQKWMLPVSHLLISLVQSQLNFRPFEPLSNLFRQFVLALQWEIMNRVHSFWKGRSPLLPNQTEYRVNSGHLVLCE